MRLRLFALLICLCLPGCWVMKVGARNPIPGMTTIAVAPFFNLTQEPNEVVDGRRFALAYYAELQKTPGFEVIPVGVVEAAMLHNNLDLRTPQGALELARILKADAVVVGAVTDYSPYYPPRIGMQVDWYSPWEWALPISGAEGAAAGAGEGGWLPGMSVDGINRICGQSPDEEEDGDGSPPVRNAASPPTAAPPEKESSRSGVRSAFGFLEPGPKGRLAALEMVPEKSPVPNSTQPASGKNAQPASPTQTAQAEATPTSTTKASNEALPTPLAPAAPAVTYQFDPTLPLMSYTRLFDGADADLVNRLRDYLELRGDRRSGGWEAHLHRSEDFIRFASHLMIVEMLSLHGGAVKTQIVFKWRKYK